MSVLDNASFLLEEDNIIPKSIGRKCKYCSEDILEGENYSIEKRRDGDAWHQNCKGAKNEKVVLEEGITPIDYAVKIKKQTNRITRLLKSKGWTFPKLSKSKGDLINIGFTGRVDDEVRVSVLSIPNPNKIDNELNADPSWIPTAILSNFYSYDKGKTWDRYQELFPFDNANAVKKTSANIMEYTLEDVYEYQDMIRSGSEMGGVWENVVKNPDSIKAKKVKTIG